MVSLTSPRVSSAIAVVLVTIFVGLVAIDVPLFTNSDVQLFMFLTIGTFIFIAAFNFAANEIKNTEGVLSVLDLAKGKILGIIVFAAFISIGYNILVIVLFEVFKGGISIQFSEQLVLGLAIFLLVYPFFQYRFLARSGEDSSIPAEFVIEQILEGMRKWFKSPTIVAMVAYFISYIIPFLFFYFYLGEIPLSLILVATILPMISLGALAGAGIGEDLIRLRMLRNPSRDWTKLGWPKINIKELKFEIGGLFLVIFAIQAVITTTLFGVYSIYLAFRPPSVGESTLIPLALTLMLTLFNKGRGATKEMKEVWSEGGFKVNIFQLFLPVYVFLGVIMSSALELFVTNSRDTGVLNNIGLNDHRAITTFVLVLQNFVLIFTAILIVKNPPGTAERRLIKEIPDFYKEDTSGYVYMHSKLKSDRSQENLLLEANKIIRDDITKANDFYDIIVNSLDRGNERVQIAASEVLMNITRRLKEHDKKYYNLVLIALNSEHVGPRIYAVRAMNNMIKHLSGEAKEEAIRAFAGKLEDEDPVVSWDTGLSLQRIISNEPEYRGFILALLIRSLISTRNESTLNSINRFLNKVARDSLEIGQMAMNILSIQLSSGKSENINNILLGIRSLLRANSYLALDLLESVSIGVENPDREIRKDYYLVLSHLAQYGSGQETEVLHFIMRGLSDESEEIQKIAYDALAKDVANHPGLVEETFEFLKDEYVNLGSRAKVGALNVFEAICGTAPELHGSILDLTQISLQDPSPAVRAALFGVYAEIAENTPSLSERIYHMSVDNINHEDDLVRVKAITAVGIGVRGNPTLARGVYRRISSARNDKSLRVQLAAIEALGFVASASRELSDSIYNELTPLLQENDWQVRLATLHGLHAAAISRKEVRDDLVGSVILTLSDSDRTVRAEAIDVLNFLLDKHRPTSETVLNAVKKELNYKNLPDELKISMYNALAMIASQRLLLVNQVLTSIQHEDFENDDRAVRAALYETLESSLEKIASSREPSQGVQKTLNKILSSILKAANHSFTQIRRDAYNGITEICISLPNFKIAKRGRNAIDAAIKQEKDVGLQEHLETCRVRAKPPLDF